ncbi:MAG TPA: hypothetical protein VGM70_02610 [Pseudolysinimonas sp.]|jgi:hypothetical protein
MMTARDAPLSTRELAGYRILRSLARDEQAEVLLGHRLLVDEDGGADGADGANGADGADRDAVETVAIKVLPATAESWESVMRLGAAFDRARGEHVVGLLDIDADEDTIRLVFERLTRGDLAALVRLRTGWEGGEAVTVLAPIVASVQRLHAAGVAHGALGPRTVMFRDDGAPTLIGFSAAELFAPGSPEVVLEQIAGVRKDRAAVRGLAVTILGRVSGGRARAAQSLLADVAGVDDESLLAFLAARLFEMASALPVRFDADEPGPDAASSTPRLVPLSSAAPAGDAGADGGPDARQRSRGVLAAALGRLVPEPLVQRLVDAAERSPAAPVARALAQRWASWSSGRRRIVLAGLVAALTVAVVTAVVPASGAAERAGSVALPTASTEPISGGPTPSRAGDPALGGDDPLAATAALLAARDRCLASLSVLCLDGVDEAGSGALADDQAAIRAAQQGAELPDPTAGGRSTGAAVLVERLGDSALVRLGEDGPASLLLVKGEAGWRIRDVMAAERSVTG